MSSDHARVAANADVFSGFAELYDLRRPAKKTKIKK